VDGRDKPGHDEEMDRWLFRLKQKSPGKCRGYSLADHENYFSVLNQSSTSLWIWSLAKP
jgi:hypothetical protein